MSDVITLQPLPPPDADFSIRLPTQDDLPCDDGMPMETPRHGFQMWLLIDALQGWLKARGNGFAGGNMFLYYSLEQIRHRDFIGPDFGSPEIRMITLPCLINRKHCIVMMHEVPNGTNMISQFLRE